MDICLSEQVMRFQNNGECIPLRDLLLEKGMIDRHTWETMFKEATESGATDTPEQSPTQIDVSENELPIELIVSNRGTKAWIKNKGLQLQDITVSQVKTMLEKRGVVTGIIADEKNSNAPEKSSGWRRKMDCGGGHR